MYLPNSLRIILMIIQSITWRTTVNLIRVATFIMYLFGLAMDRWIAVLLASLPCLLECWYIFKNLSLNNAGWAVNNRRGRLLSYPPLCVIWSAGFDLEEVSGLCCSGRMLCSPTPPIFGLPGSQCLIHLRHLSWKFIVPELLKHPYELSFL